MITTYFQLKKSNIYVKYHNSLTHRTYIIRLKSTDFAINILVTLRLTVRCKAKIANALSYFGTITKVFHTFSQTYTLAYIDTNTHIYIYICMHVCIYI